MDVHDVGTLASQNPAHHGRYLRMVKVDGPIRRLRQRMMSEVGQVGDIQWRQPVDDNPFGRHLPAEPDPCTRFGRDHDHLVILSEGPGQPADVDLRAALHEWRVEVADEADSHAGFASGLEISPTSAFRAASILLTWASQV